ncbi:kinase-like domain-containing protein [Gilbertella persicaria]|uniref:kinase-like domain-containing protein n=1 Tax=Gilbertella persicaria TaxID=101096 RepID=UPI00221FBF73|nr:kinase-like domain-containing protein [Gilbertella persicaria]KAI8047562.1 kinase-like domain-containing protein [Gilbertella persicaria]
MNAVVSTISILAYSCKIFAEKLSPIIIIPTRSQSDITQQYPPRPIHKSKSEACLSVTEPNLNYNMVSTTAMKDTTETTSHTMNHQEQESCKEHRHRKEELDAIHTAKMYSNVNIKEELSFSSTSGTNQAKRSSWDNPPPLDIQRPNCIPGIGPFNISDFRDEEEEDYTLPIQYDEEEEEDEDEDDEDEHTYDTKKSHTPSFSGDSGYGTAARRKTNRKAVKEEEQKVQDLFESLFAPIPTTPDVQQQQIATPPSLKMHPPSTPASTHSKLSLLFSKKKNKSSKEPHFIKFQTWSSQNQQHSTIDSRRPYEEDLFKSAKEKNEQLSLLNFLEENRIEPCLPPTIQVQSPTKNRPRRRTDASLTRVLLPSKTEQKQIHSQCQSIKSIPEQKTIIPQKSVSSSLNAVGDNNLELSNEQGNVVARYKLGNVIGKGHFGTVYRALDLISGKTVAIKQVSLKDARKSDIEDMMQEASLLSSLTHSNIVKYEGFIQTQDHMNIVLEFVENGSLLHTLKHFGNALPENLVASYCHDILQGLAYLHQQDVVHCDLKAANILTTKTGDVKLSDFGVSLSLKLKSQDEDNMVSGTPFWMSPEVIELKGVSVQSDIWSLGCTIVELCTGKPPYAELITMTAMFKIVEDDCPPLPDNISDVSLYPFIQPGSYLTQ